MKSVSTKSTNYQLDKTIKNLYYIKNLPLDKDYEIINIKNRHVFKIIIDSNYFILKTKKRNLNIIKVIRNNIRFYKEIKITTKINTIVPEITANLIYSNFRYAIYEYIESEENSYNKDLVLNSLKKYSEINLDQGFSNSLKYGKMKTISFSLIIILIKSFYVLGFRILFNLFSKLYSFKIKYSENIICLIHKDLTYKSNFIMNKRGFYLIDLESTILEDLFILNDIITHSFDYNNLTINVGLIYEYCTLSGFSFSVEYINEQIFFCLLRFSLGKLLSSGFDRNFLFNTLLDDRMFYKWLSENYQR